MGPIELSIKKPVTVTVAVILLVLFGLISLSKLPYQLSPDVTEPVITVTTTWRGATPYEVERDIIEEQEKVLNGIPGLTEMESTSANGIGTVTLTFRIGTSVDVALLRVSNKINEVPSYPVNVDKPVITATGASSSPVIWMILKADKDNPQHIYTYRTYFENEIRQYLERVDGVASLFIGGGTMREMHVVADPKKLVAHDLTITDLINSLQAENVNVSAGDMDVGRRDFRIRTVAEFSSPQDISKVVVKSDGQHIVTVADVADVRFGYEKLTAPILFDGQPGIAMGIQAEPGVNILDLTDRVRAVVNRLNEEKLKPQKINLEWVYDESPYIRGAISLVRHDIFLGGALAVAILLVFLQSFYPTLVVTTAIPISILGTFIFMLLLGRNLNVVSLAGISFAVGMLVDDAIVVLDNIDRHRGMGKSPFAAAYDGTREVWGAVLASTLTRVAVFLPVVFLQQEAGQLFRDIAIAVSVSVMLSLFVSVSVIPMLSKQLFSLRVSLPARIPRPGMNVFRRIGKVLLGMYMGLVRLVVRNTLTRIVTIAGLTGFAVIVTVLLFPKMEYLPQGNRNFVINILIPPPGLSVDARKSVGDYIAAQTKPYLGKDFGGFPGIEHLFYVGTDQIMLFGAMSTHEQRAGELVPLFMRIMNSIPGMFGVSSQAGVFQTRLGRGRTLSVDISGSDINQLVKVGGALFGIIQQQIPNAQVRPVPSLELLYPEVNIVPSRERLQAAQMSAQDLGVSLAVLQDGLKIGDFSQPGMKKIDLIVKSPRAEAPTPESLYEEMLFTRTGQSVPISSLASFVRSEGMTQIRHYERNRTITLEVTPPSTITIQGAMETIQQKILPMLRSQGMLQGIDVGMSGTADRLTEARKALQGNFILAAIIIYLLMCALYENFLYPLIIMFTVPLAAAGGFIGLKLVNVFLAPQPFDILTMLGFVILVGVVTNNAILIVHQALNNIRYHGMEYKEAVIESTRTRLRPIYMSSLTSIFGLLPLVLVPGPGSEMYRGLGSVVLGGLALSTVFTIFLIPPFLMFFIKFEKPHTQNT